MNTKKAIEKMPKKRKIKAEAITKRIVKDYGVTIRKLAKT